MKLDDVYEDLLGIVSCARAQVDVPIESEHFFEALVEGFQGSKEEFLSYVRANIERWFNSVPAGGPNWIHEAEWKFHNGKPMTFVGEVLIPKEAGLFHDDASVFVFLSEDGVTKCVVQVA